MAFRAPGKSVGDSNASLTRIVSYIQYQSEAEAKSRPRRYSAPVLGSRWCTSGSIAAPTLNTGSVLPDNLFEQRSVSVCPNRVSWSAGVRPTAPRRLSKGVAFPNDRLGPRDRAERGAMIAVTPRMPITLKRTLLYCLVGWGGAVMGRLAVRGLSIDSIVMLVAGGVAGAFCGLIPYFVGRFKNRGLAITSVWICAAAGAALGVFLALPVALVFTFFLARPRPAPPRVTLDRAKAAQVLGVAGEATADEIRVAYHDLIRVWHPDRFCADDRLRSKAEETLKGINEAYGLLRAPRQTETAWTPDGKPPHSSHPPPDNRTTNRRDAPRGEENIPAKGSSHPRLLILAVSGFVALCAIGAGVGYLQAHRRTDTRDPSPTSAVTLDEALPRLENLAEFDRSWIQRICGPKGSTPSSRSFEQFMCERDRLAELAACPGPPDLTQLAPAVGAYIKTLCMEATVMRGPGAYYRCMRDMTDRLPRRE